MIRLSHPTKILEAEIALPGSKSISNRILMLQKLYEPDLQISGLSPANDSLLMARLLHSSEAELNVEDAGTVMRFILAYSAVNGGEKILRGTARMHKRPIRELVDALRLLGADIEYLEKEGYPPLKVKARQLKIDRPLDCTQVRSSQFISALLMIAPKVEGDFSLKFNVNMGSFPYILLTIKTMRRMGFSVRKEEDMIYVSPIRRFEGEFFKVEPDWTSFYYWYSMAMLAEEVKLFFPGLNQHNMQTERNRLYDIGNTQLQFEQTEGGFLIKKSRDPGKLELPRALNYHSHPDLAPTFAFLLAALQCDTCKFSGLESLKFKECDREAAIQEQLGRLNVSFKNHSHHWILKASDFFMEESHLFNTYEDHRMALSAAPLSLIRPILIEDETVVQKSYPGFWEQLKTTGFFIDFG